MRKKMMALALVCALGVVSALLLTSCKKDDAEKPEGTSSSTKESTEDTSEEDSDQGSTEKPAESSEEETKDEATEAPTEQPTEPEDDLLYSWDFNDGAGDFTSRGNTALKINKENPYEGSGCLKISNRTENWWGAQMDVSAYMKTGGSYEIVVWVRQDSGKQQNLDCKLDYVDVDGKQTYLGIGSVTCPDSEWTQMNIVIDSLPNYTGKLNLYFENYESTGWDFYLDSFSISGSAAPEQGPSASLEEIYDDMIANSLIQVGNAARIQQAIQKAQNGEDVTIAYLGGSITEGASASTSAQCYASLSYQYFADTYGTGENVHFVNAGMGGTTSTLGMIRYERDILLQGYYITEPVYPDVVFIEFAVNDGDDPTMGESYESVIRNVLNAPNQPAVILLFSVFESQWNLQDRFIPLGKAYDLPMISIKNAVVPVINSGTLTNREFFATDGMHPTNLGHQIMADCIAYYYQQVDLLEQEQIAEVPEEVVIGNAFEGMLMIDSKTQKEGIEINPGSFTTQDNTTGTYMYDSKRQKMGDNWKHTSSSGSESFTLKVNCKSLAMAYKLSSASSAGAVEIYVDGVQISPLISTAFNKAGNVDTVTSYSSGGWNNAWTAILFANDTAEEHTIEIKMAAGDEAKEFTILGFGYVE